LQHRRRVPRIPHHNTPVAIKIGNIKQRRILETKSNTISFIRKLPPLSARDKKHNLQKQYELKKSHHDNQRIKANA
jgi:hypothetical protein